MIELFRNTDISKRSGNEGSKYRNCILHVASLLYRPQEVALFSSEPEPTVKLRLLNAMTDDALSQSHSMTAHAEFPEFKIALP
jgi:hypothetical protein